ncbi:MAG: GGDEF domain-containing protein [Burkholderiaceae bacterium]
MVIDIPTLLLALLIGFLLLSMQLQVAQRGALRHSELRIWAYGSWAMVAALTMLGLRLWLPLWLSIMLGNGLLFLTIALYGEALFRHLLARPQPRWYWALTAAACLLLAGTLELSIPVLTALVSFLMAFLLLWPTWLVLRHGWHGEASMRVVGLTLSLACLALALRGVHALHSPGQYAHLLQGSVAQKLTFLLGFFALLGAGFGFVLACFERVARRMEEMATLDGMTGCVNRSTADALLSHMLERGRREGEPVAFALLDLDLFKQINDCFGHLAGDQALRVFAAEVRLRLRSSDVLGRMGGEEFGLLLPATDAAGATRLVEQVRAAIEALDLSCPQGQHFRLTVSIGVAVAQPDRALSADALYMQADRALYRAKAGGRNRVQLGEGGGGGDTDGGGAGADAEAATLPTSRMPSLPPLSPLSP